jgi:hypothetical protein
MPQRIPAIVNPKAFDYRCFATLPDESSPIKSSPSNSIASRARKKDSAWLGELVGLMIVAGDDVDVLLFAFVLDR